jgi:hypothetical protein
MIFNRLSSPDGSHYADVFTDHCFTPACQFSLMVSKLLPAGAAASSIRKRWPSEVTAHERE